MTPISVLKPHLVEAPSYRAISSDSPFWYGKLIHLYLELKLGLQLEGAEGLQNARSAQKYIRLAAEAAQVTCDVFNGQLLEIHGRTLHLGLEYENAASLETQMKGAAALLHVLLKRAYGAGGPDGWRMAADHGITLTVQAVGIHNDTSLVSLSPAANFPAKMLGRDEVSLWELGSNLQEKWECENLDELASRYRSAELASVNKSGQGSPFDRLLERRAHVRNFSSLEEIQTGIKMVSAQAASVGRPTDENPYSSFAVVLSMDLDGFTHRVKEAAEGTIEDKRRLAQDFRDIMTKTAAFATSRRETLIQFPFAGDNAIFAVVTESTSEYALMKKINPIEVAVAWEKEMGDKARAAGFGGWGQVVAGGSVPNGNSRGNLHVSGIELAGRRFLVGIGPGMRYSREGFSHVDPSPKHVAIFQKDLPDLHEFLREVFEPCRSNKSDVSSVYKMARLADLDNALTKVSEKRTTAVSKLADARIALTTGSIISRPYAE
jgi:hypothetical protein